MNRVSEPRCRKSGVNVVHRGQSKHTGVMVARPRLARSVPGLEGPLHEPRCAAAPSQALQFPAEKPQRQPPTVDLQPSPSLLLPAQFESPFWYVGGSERKTVSPNCASAETRMTRPGTLYLYGQARRLVLPI